MKLKIAIIFFLLVAPVFVNAFYYEDNFNSYTVGDMTFIDDQSDWWDTYGSATTTATTTIAYGFGKSAYLENPLQFYTFDSGDFGEINFQTYNLNTTTTGISSVVLLDDNDIIFTLNWACNVGYPDCKIWPSSSTDYSYAFVMSDWTKISVEWSGSDVEWNVGLGDNWQATTTAGLNAVNKIRVGGSGSPNWFLDNFEIYTYGENALDCSFFTDWHDCLDNGCYWIHETVPYSFIGDSISATPSFIEYCSDSTTTDDYPYCSDDTQYNCQFCSEAECETDGKKCHWDSITEVCVPLLDTCGEGLLALNCTNSTDCATYGGTWCTSTDGLATTYCTLGECHWSDETSWITDILDDIPVVKDIVFLFVSPSNWISEQIAKLNPLKKPPFSWIASVISYVGNKVRDLEDGTISESEYLTGDDFGQATLTIGESTSTFAFFDMGSVQTGNANFFATVRTIAGFMLYIGFFSYLLYKIKSFMHKEA